MHTNKLLLLFPDGVGIRNYIYANVFDPDDDLVLFHNFDRETVAYLFNFQRLTAEVEIPVYKESAREKFLRELVALSRLYRGVSKTGNKTLLRNWNWRQEDISKKVFYKAIEVLAPFFKSDAQIAWLDANYQKAIRKSGFYSQVKEILRSQKPSSVFCSHQRAIKVAPIFAAAQDLNIPSVTVIYSWDNLPKGRLALQADQYWVWSEQMKNDMQLFFPEIQANKIVITGTPQFSFYKDSANIIARETFFKTYGLDLSKKIICFSGDDEMTSPDDPKYLYDLAESITQAGLENQFQILMRRSPADFSGRYDKVIEQFSDLVKSAPPLWSNAKGSGWAGIFPLYEDVKNLVSTAYYCDLVINIGSTMAFDFAMFDKPCLFINYDQPHQENREWSVKMCYQSQHFRTMDGLDPVGWINDKSEIVNLILKATTKPESVGPDRRKWMDRIALQPFSANFKNLVR